MERRAGLASQGRGGGGCVCGWRLLGFAPVGRRGFAARRLRRCPLRGHPPGATPAAPGWFCCAKPSRSPLARAGALGGSLFAGSARYARQGLPPLDPAGDVRITILAPRERAQAHSGDCCSRGAAPLRPAKGCRPWIPPEMYGSRFLLPGSAGCQPAGAIRWCPLFARAPARRRPTVGFAVGLSAACSHRCLWPVARSPRSP